MFIQDEAIKLAKIFPECNRLVIIASKMCCASVALWIMGIDEKEHLSIIADELGKSLDDECTVYWDKFFEKVAGRKINVEFKDIKKESELKQIKGRIAVRYDYNGHSHWVGYENGKLAYNSLESSACVKFGKPTTTRIITLA